MTAYRGSMYTPDGLTIQNAEPARLCSLQLSLPALIGRQPFKNFRRATDLLDYLVEARRVLSPHSFFRDRQDPHRHRPGTQFKMHGIADLKLMGRLARTFINKNASLVARHLSNRAALDQSRDFQPFVQPHD